MLKGAFFRSTLRQPVKTVLLLILTGLITIAFVALISESRRQTGWESIIKP